MQQQPQLDFERIYVDYVDFYGQDMVERHKNRYHWASTYITKKSVVLDACCGTGYGSKILADNCKYVIGIDKDERAINYARDKYQKQNITFNQFDITDCEGEIHIFFNTIVCIEAIEHITKKEAEKVLKMFSDLLVNGGKLVLTTPDKKMSTNKNEYHKQEYTEEEIKDLVSKHFYIDGVTRKENFIYIVARKNGYN